VSCLQLNRSIALFGVVLLLLGCGTGIVSSGESVAQNHSAAYKYHRTIRTIDGRSRQDDGNTLKPGERYAYSYGFRRSDLERLDHDISLAIKKFIVSRNAAPQCTLGFEVVKIGTTENMGIVIGVIVCVESGK